MKKKTFTKKLFTLLLSFTLVFPTVASVSPTEVQAASTAAKAKAAYASILKRPFPWSDSYMNPSDLRFAVIDINNDKVPELYVGTKKWDYSYDYKLLGYVDNKVKCLYSFRRGSKLQKFYPSKGTILCYGEYNKGRNEKIYLKFNGKKLTPQVSQLYSRLDGTSRYSIPGANNTYKTISKAKYNSIVKTLTAGTAKNAPKLYNNIAAYRTKYLDTSTTSSGLFETGTYYGFTNGGFYLKIGKISGNKLTCSIRMPYMSRNNITATVASGKRTASAKFTCSEGISHSLVLKVDANAIIVQETSSCTSKLLASSSSDNYKKQISHTFSLDNYFSG